MDNMIGRKVQFHHWLDGQKIVGEIVGISGDYYEVLSDKGVTFRVSKSRVQFI